MESEDSLAEGNLEHDQGTEGLRENEKINSGNIRAWTYDMRGHVEQCVERYCELAQVKPEDLKQMAKK